MTFWVAGAAVVGSIGGALISSNAAGDAADAQVGASDRANASQERIADKQIQFQRDAMDKQIGLQQPFRNIGLGAQNQLAFLIGLSDTGYDATDPQVQAIRNRLQPQFFHDLGGGSSWLDGAGLQAAVDAELKKNGQFGSLMKDFSEAPPSPADFSMKDFQADPGYQFRLDEGQKALERSAAARGGLFSGRAMKDTLRFAQGLGSQEYGNAFNRFQTNRANQIGDWQNRLNLFNINRTNKLNPLQSLGGVGQSATNQMGAAAAGFAQGASGALGSYGQNLNNNIIGAGNAQAAGQVGAANAMNNGISQGISMYQNQQLLNRLVPRQSFPTYGGAGISGGGGFGTGEAFGNQDYGQFF